MLLGVGQGLDPGDGLGVTGVARSPANRSAAKARAAARLPEPRGPTNSQAWTGSPAADERSIDTVAS